MSPQQQAAQQAAGFVQTFNQVILFPTIALLSAVAFLVFLWGCAQYVFNANNDQARQQGVKHITWGIIGLVVMLSAWAILEIAVATFGLTNELNCADDPSTCSGEFVLPSNSGSTGDGGLNGNSTGEGLFNGNSTGDGGLNDNAPEENGFDWGR